LSATKRAERSILIALGVASGVGLMLSLRATGTVGTADAAITVGIFDVYEQFGSVREQKGEGRIRTTMR
jgi:hypothetical protein